MVEKTKDTPRRIEAMFLLAAHGDIKGLVHWAEELERRKMPAVIDVEEQMIDNHPDMIKHIADGGFVVSSGIPGPLWDKSYEYQYGEIKRCSEKIQLCTNKPMRKISSTYFSYDENTVKAADRLGIPFVTARGTAGARAVFYKPKEYNVKIISVSNVPSKQMGTGSLCDISLWSRGETPDDFIKILFNLTVDKVIVVAHAHLSGVKLHWWNVYQELFNADIMNWKSLDEFAVDFIELPYKEIPINREVQYTTPQPKIPLEQETDFPF
jgi:hypothetical protein